MILKTKISGAKAFIKISSLTTNVDNLSGGQRQRVALARAIISDNPICLMDEPLSNLDAKLRHQMRVEIRELQKKLGITMIYVTHDQTEAMSMADKIVLMNEGHIVQQGKPKELFENPNHMFTAKFLGNPPMNIIETEHDGENHFINHNGEKIDFMQDNKKDLVEIPKNILNDLEITTVKTVDEVLKVALVKELKPIEWIEVESLPKSKSGEKPSTGSTH